MKKLLILLFFLTILTTLQAQSIYTAEHSWTPAVGPIADHYDISRGTQGGPYTLVVSIPHPTTTFNETGLSGPNCWILTAVSVIGSSTPTTEICIGVPGTPQGYSITFTVTVP